jgi:hypothetical protein
MGADKASVRGGTLRPNARDTGFRAAALLHRPAMDDPRAGDHPEVESMTFAGSSKSRWSSPPLHRAARLNSHGLPFSRFLSQISACTTIVSVFVSPAGLEMPISCA